MDNSWKEERERERERIPKTLTDFLMDRCESERWALARSCLGDRMDGSRAVCLLGEWSAYQTCILPSIVNSKVASRDLTLQVHHGRRPGRGRMVI